MILTGYELEPLHDDGDFSLYRARKASHAVTMLALVAARPTSRSVARLVHEYRLAPFLDASWAAHPLALDPRREPPMLVLDDDGGEPCGASCAVLSNWRVCCVSPSTSQR